MSTDTKKRAKNRTAMERYQTWMAEISDIAERRYEELKEADQLEAAIKMKDFHKKILEGDTEIMLKEISELFEGKEGDAANG